MLRCFFLSSILFSSSFLLGQPKVDALIVNFRNDTLYGKIKSDFNLLAYSVQFWEEGKSDSYKLNFTDINRIEIIKDGVVYKRMPATNKVVNIKKYNRNNELSALMQLVYRGNPISIYEKPFGSDYIYYMYDSVSSDFSIIDYDLIIGEYDNKLYTVAKYWGQMKKLATREGVVIPSKKRKRHYYYYEKGAIIDFAKYINKDTTNLK